MIFGAILSNVGGTWMVEILYCSDGPNPKPHHFFRARSQRTTARNSRLFRRWCSYPRAAQFFHGAHKGLRISLFMISSSADMANPPYGRRLIVVR